MLSRHKVWGKSVCQVYLDYLVTLEKQAHQVSVQQVMKVVCLDLLVMMENQIHQVSEWQL